MSTPVSWLLTVLAAVPYALGWSAGVIVRAAAWAWTALAVGWTDGRGRTEEGKR